MSAAGRRTPQPRSAAGSSRAARPHHARSSAARRAARASPVREGRQEATMNQQVASLTCGPHTEWHEHLKLTFGSKPARIASERARRSFSAAELPPSAAI
eukprot:5796198-Prymnesium_polylepis.1